MKRSMLPLTALRAFEATMRHGQMKLAAGELGVTHGAVSRQVRRLEDTLGIVLFKGPRNKLVPSQAARELHATLQDAFDRIETAVARVRRRGRRTLDISCLGTFAMRWLIPHLFDFHERHPDIEIRMTADDGPVDFARDRFDAAIRVGSGPWLHSRAIELFADRAGPVVSPGILPKIPHITWDEIAELPLLHTRTRPLAWADWCRATGHTLPPGGREFEHFYFLLEAATAGLGVAIAPEVLVRNDLKAGRLTAPFGFHPTGGNYVVLVPETESADTKVFIDWLETINQRETTQTADIERNFQDISND